MDRLETLSLSVATKLRRASPEKQRRACLVACELAIASVQLRHSLVSDSLQTLRSGGVSTPQERSRLDALAAQLDEEYFKLQEASEPGQPTTHASLLTFSQARAVSALSFALSGTIDAASKSIYEAAAAIGENNSTFLSAVESAIK